MCYGEGPVKKQGDRAEAAARVIRVFILPVSDPEWEPRERVPL